MVSINQLVEIVSCIAGKMVNVNCVPGPLGVRGRNSDNTLISERLGWTPSLPLEEGLKRTYKWISEMVAKDRITM